MESAKGKAAAEASYHAMPTEDCAGPDATRLVTALLADPQQLQALRRALGFPTHPALPLMHPYRPESVSVLRPSSCV